MPCPLGAGDNGDIAGLKCRNLTYDVFPQRCGCARGLISSLNSRENSGRRFRLLLFDVPIDVPNIFHLLCSGEHIKMHYVIQKGSLVKVCLCVKIL